MMALFKFVVGLMYSTVVPSNTLLLTLITRVVTNRFKSKYLMKVLEHLPIKHICSLIIITT